MLIVLGVLLAMLAPVVVLLAVAEARDRRRARVIARQIMLTDAVHAELGAVVAPVVEKHAFHPWRVIYPVRDRRAPEIGRLLAITDRVFRPELRPAEDVEVVFTRSARAA